MQLAVHDNTHGGNYSETLCPARAVAQCVEAIDVCVNGRAHLHSSQVAPANTAATHIILRSKNTMKSS